MSASDPQGSSVSFQTLPTEIRLEIYSQLFYSTRLSFGKRPVSVGDHLKHVRVRPALNSLALLRVCSQVNSEIGDTWLGQVLFNFVDLETMLNKLTDLGPQTLAKLRHVHYSGIRGDQNLYVGRSSARHREQHKISLAHALKMLPGLCLERLTVFGHESAHIAYVELEQLINHSDGWKELRYVSENSIMLGFQNMGQQNMGHLSACLEFVNTDPWFLRKPQPSNWSQALAGRDGPTAVVRIYRSSHATEYGTLLHKSATWQAFDDQVAEPGGHYGIEWETALMVRGERLKALLVIASRGEGVDYAERQDSPLIPGDIRSRWPGMTWRQLRGIDPSRAYPMADAYEHIDEFESSDWHNFVGYP